MSEEKPEVERWPNYELKLRAATHEPVATLRDQFAMAALTGILANPGNDYLSRELVAEFIFDQADKCMKVREGK